MASRQYDICIVGAGIIGLAIAFRLARRGLRVAIVDRKGMAEEASKANAGAFAFCEIEPLASPGIILKAPRWLLDRLGPLSLPPSYVPRIAPWLLRFFRASRSDRLAAGTRAQTALMALSRAETGPLLAEAGLAGSLRRDGALYLYAGQRAFEAAAGLWRGRERHGIAFEHVTGGRLAALQPGLGERYTHAMFVPQWMTVSDPHNVATGLGEAAVAIGAVFARGEAVDVDVREDTACVKLADGTAIPARQVVIACGAWSHRLAARLGHRIPLETERAYNTTLPPGAFDLRRQIVLPADGYVITPLETGVRVGGAVELAGLERPPDFRRADIMLRKAASVLPGLRVGGGRQWMGFRPSLPDSLPVIGRTPSSRNVFYAFGHGHLGLTQSAGTARLIADLVLGQPPPIDMSPYGAERF